MCHMDNRVCYIGSLLLVVLGIFVVRKGIVKQNAEVIIVNELFLHVAYRSCSLFRHLGLLAFRQLLNKAVPFRPFKLLLSPLDFTARRQNLHGLAFQILVAQEHPLVGVIVNDENDWFMRCYKGLSHGPSPSSLTSCPCGN